MHTLKYIILMILLSLYIAHTALAGPLRDRLKQRKTAQEKSSPLEESISAKDSVSLPEGITVLRDIAYGDHSKQKIDIYLANTSVKDAPVIFMVHGGAWRLGDKAMSRVVQNKVARWVPQGFIFISANYRLLPDTKPLEQAEDVARALALAQSKVTSWGGDPSKFIIMGHSAGAHLVALLGANPDKAYSLNAKPWLGTVSLDSAALNLVTIMEKQHHRFYDKAFGPDSTYWKANSPGHVLTPSAKPLLAVCSSQRSDGPCPNARDYAAKTAAMGLQTKILEQNLSHAAINENLGKPGSYTDAVEEFMASLDNKVAELLRKR